jgi:two-component system CheB/CheR fusion protein
MPNSAIYTNLVDLIYTPKKIALYLSKLNVAQLTKAKITEGEASESFLIKILKEIEKSSGINFVDYKRNTIIRRIEKRMGLNGINQISDYYDFIKDDNTEKSTLVRDLLIGVTSFFRDTDAFNDLEKYVISKIFTNKEQGEKRIWVEGCSTGEEAYSIAMLIENHLNENKLKINYKIFASDLDPNALEKASEGIFSIGDKDTIKTELFDKYFKRIGDKVQVIKKIRDRIVFSKHNLLKDPPFIRTDLVSCRNLLIYLNNKLQQKALMNFQFSLNFKGYLFLGKSESINNYSKGYSTINSKSNIYQNIAKNKKLTGNYFDSNTNRSFNDFSSQYNSQVKSDKNKLIDEFNFHKYLSVNFAPSAIFFDEDYNILFIKGDQGKFLKIKEGYFDNNLLNLLDDSVSKIIRASVNKLNKDSREILVKGVNT